MITLIILISTIATLTFTFKYFTIAKKIWHPQSIFQSIGFLLVTILVSLLLIVLIIVIGSFFIASGYASPFDFIVLIVMGIFLGAIPSLSFVGCSYLFKTTFKKA